MPKWYALPAICGINSSKLFGSSFPLPHNVPLLIITLPNLFQAAALAGYIASDLRKSPLSQLEFTKVGVVKSQTISAQHSCSSCNGGCMTEKGFCILPDKHLPLGHNNKAHNDSHSS
jgi:hypothetical protein